MIGNDKGIYGRDGVAPGTGALLVSGLATG